MTTLTPIKCQSLDLQRHHLVQSKGSVELRKGHIHTHEGVAASGCRTPTSQHHRVQLRIFPAPFPPPRTSPHALTLHAIVDEGNIHLSFVRRLPLDSSLSLSSGPPRAGRYRRQSNQKPATTQLELYNGASSPTKPPPKGALRVCLRKPQDTKLP